MKKVLAFVLYTATTLGFANGAVRDGTTVARRTGDTPTQSRVATTPVKSVSERGGATTTSTVSRAATSSTANTTNTGGTTSARTATPQKTVTSSRATTSRAATSGASVSTVSRAATSAAATTTRPTVTSARTAATGAAVATAVRSATAPATTTSTARRAVTPQSVVRAAIDATTSITETRTGAEYEKCKTAYFTCMDQFCKLKNDDYRRCSCSDRVYDLADARDVITAAGEQLTAFTENLDTVGMTAAQATAMRTESEGEAALTSDKSASKALLQAIMNSIKGEDTNVGGKYSDLNTINLSFDTSGTFGEMDAGATVAMYNGSTLYSAVYPRCREAVRADCNDASLQRAITAYLMAVESDCNTVQAAVESTQKTMKAAVREGSAMLDLARVENRKNHNSSDINTCVANVEAAILSEEVCGANYHKCLDNGEFIDVSTGAPITGVTNFYELQTLLTFATGVDATDQQLSKVKANQTFVNNFESRVKKFAKPALDKCIESADFVWAEYLDRALLDIYYAQRSKVEEIKQGCFDFVAACYVNGDKALTTAMAELTGDSALILQPNKVKLTAQMCTDYVASCDNMFDGIVAEYINNRTQTDTIAACRAVAQQCFDKFGGTGYENFYYPNSGLFPANDISALDWFTLYDKTSVKADGNYPYLSTCAKQLADIEACSDKDILEQVFGGFDKISTLKNATSNKCSDKIEYQYGSTDATPTPGESTCEVYASSADSIDRRKLRPTGVATEVYNQIIDTLSTQCRALQGKFMEAQFILDGRFDQTNYCMATFPGTQENNTNPYKVLAPFYGVWAGENMCPRDYQNKVNTQAWGACLCWENGARRSRNGTSVKCEAVLPTKTSATSCMTVENDTMKWTAGDIINNNTKPAEVTWCTMDFISNYDQVCTKVTGDNPSYKLVPGKTDSGNAAYCPSPADSTTALEDLPKGLNI